MVEDYHPKDHIQKRHVIKEIIQEIVMCGLSKSGFFNDAAFYGDSALRIFYGLNRFSEDLDLALQTENADFDLTAYLPTLESMVNSFGLNIVLETQNKSKNSEIQSAFLKKDTFENFLLFYPNELVRGVNKNEKVKIKFEIDTKPSDLATFETKFKLLQTPYSIKMYDEPSLFSGKIHAVICRSWKSKVKGRDLYDFIFYLSRKTKFNLPHLQEKLIDSHYIPRGSDLTLDDVKIFLIKRFNEINFNEAKSNVMPFIKDTSVLDIWSKEFFTSVTSELRT